MTTPTDVRCAAFINGDRTLARRYDAERIWGWIIALLQDDEDAALQVQQQIGDCPNCLRAAAGGLAGLLSGKLLEYGRDNAEKTAQYILVELLSSSDLLDTDPPPDGFALQE